MAQRHFWRLTSCTALAVAVAIGFKIWPARAGTGGATTSTAATQAAASVTTAPVGTLCYESNFEKGAGNEWSDTFTATTPNPVKTYLAPSVEEPIILSLQKLPPHKFINLKFELLIIDRWNGDGANFGRDLMDIRVIGGQPLVHTTFGNCGFWDNNNEQSFPDQYPWYPTHPAWTGAAAHQSLGFKTSQGPDSYGVDSTYMFDLTFPHTDDTIDVSFTTKIKNHDHKPFGILSCKVSTLERGATADEKTIAGWWNDLAGEDPVKANQAVWSLVATGDLTSDYLSTRVPAAAEGENAPPLNIDQRKDWSYGCFKYDTAEARQRARAIHVLEAIGTPAAHAVLDQIGYFGTPEGAPPDRFGQ